MTSYLLAITRSSPLYLVLCSIWVASGVVADPLSSMPMRVPSLVGIWSGLDGTGQVITYVFDDDGSAAIYENEMGVLLGDSSCQVKWKHDNDGNPSKLDIKYEDSFGSSVVVPYLLSWNEDGSILLNSGGALGRRPELIDEGMSSMRIRLVKQIAQ